MLGKHEDLIKVLDHQVKVNQTTSKGPEVKRERPGAAPAWCCQRDQGTVQICSDLRPQASFSQGKRFSTLLLFKSVCGTLLHKF